MRLFLNRIHKTVSVVDFLSIYQFGFSCEQCTIQLYHGVVQVDSGEQGYVRISLSRHTAVFWWSVGCGNPVQIKTIPARPFLLHTKIVPHVPRYLQVKYGDALSNYFLTLSGVPRGSVLGASLYPLFMADVQLTNVTFIGMEMATCADDTAITSSDADAARATDKLQSHLNLLQHCLRRWKANVNADKSTQITFKTKHSLCPQHTINNTLILIRSEEKYLGLHFDIKFSQETSVGARSLKYVWVINKKSNFSTKIKYSSTKPCWNQHGRAGLGDGAAQNYKTKIL